MTIENYSGFMRKISTIFFWVCDNKKRIFDIWIILKYLFYHCDQQKEFLVAS